MLTDSRGRLLACALALGLSAELASAQTTATYSDRAKLRTDAAFLGRIEIACLNAAIGVILEDPATEEHATRKKMAAYVLREPSFVAQRLGTLLAAIAPAQVSTDGTVTTPLTDAQLLALIQQRWTLLSQSLITP